MGRQDYSMDGVLDRTLIEAAEPAIDRKRPVYRTFPIRNSDRTVGAMLSGEIVRRVGDEGLPDGTLRFGFTGSAGQSFGAFCVRGVTLTLEGEANDFLGKGLSGGRLVIFPPRTARFDPAETIIAGNVALYGATSGEVYIGGLAGERFGVRNSGAVAVVEGVGDHGCEYMTGGVVVVLGRTGRNFAAGMSGGVAFVLDEDRTFEQRCNKSLVLLEAVDDERDERLLKRLVERHARLTDSKVARRMLRHWTATLARCVRVIPTEYKRVLAERPQLLEIHHDRRLDTIPDDSARRPAAQANSRADVGLA